MGRLKRMTEEEFNMLTAEYEEVDKQYKVLREYRTKLKKRIDWYNYSKNQSQNYKQGMAFQLFGKRMKDLTPEELREYNRISARKSRQKAKESAKFDKGE